MGLKWEMRHDAFVQRMTKSRMAQSSGPATGTETFKSPSMARETMARETTCGRLLLLLALAAHSDAVPPRATLARQLTFTMPWPNMPRRALLNSATAAAILSHCRPPAAAAGASAAVFAQRFSVAGNISPLPPLGQYSRYEDQLSSPKGAKALSLTMHFDFPQQFQQIGRALGGIAFVDGNSGLRVFVLRAPLPGTALAETPKQWFAESIFSPDGQLVREGVEIDAYKTTSAKMIDAPEGAATARRRIALKYTVITPANQRATDRFAFADVYEVEGVAYILFTSAGATKWEGGEKERCERIADSFFVG